MTKNVKQIVTTSGSDFLKQVVEASKVGKIDYDSFLKIGEAYHVLAEYDDSSKGAVEEFVAKVAEKIEVDEVPVVKPKKKSTKAE